MVRRWSAAPGIRLLFRRRPEPRRRRPTTVGPRQGVLASATPRRDQRRRARRRRPGAHGPRPRRDRPLPWRDSIPSLRGRRNASRRGEVSSTPLRAERRGGPAVSEHDDVERLRAERDALEQRVGTLEARPQRRRRLARISATLLVVLAVLCFALAVPATWAKRTLLDTDRYVATVAPLARDPAVQEYLARTVTQPVFAALDVQTRRADVLQKRAAQLTFLAGPIATGVQGFVQEQLQAVFASDAFASAWEEANRFVHSQLLVVLEGSPQTAGGQPVEVNNGAIVLNLLPLVNQGLQAMTGLVTDLIGHPVTLPQISGDEVPSEAITRLESALGIDLPDQFGTITVYNAEDLAAVQKAVDLAGRLIVLVVVLFLLLAALALWISPRKRRTLLQLGVAAAVALVIERRLAIAEGNNVVASAKVENQAAARVVVDQVLAALLRYTGWLLVIALVVVL